MSKSFIKTFEKFNQDQIETIEIYLDYSNVNETVQTKISKQIKNSSDLQKRLRKNMRKLLLITSDLYEEINQGKYQVLMTKHVKMTQSEVKQIKDELESFGVRADDSINDFEQRYLICGSYNGLTEPLYSRVKMTIAKIEDDYFLLRLPDIDGWLGYDRFFKCDVIEGLFEIIEIYLS
jgi:hypothetical protein